MKIRQGFDLDGKDDQEMRDEICKALAESGHKRSVSLITIDGKIIVRTRNPMPDAHKAAIETKLSKVVRR